MQKEAKIETSASAALSDYDAITNTVHHYINGGQTGRTAEMKLAFHPDATIFGYVGPDLFAGPIQKLFDWNDQNGPAAELQGRITSIDLVETVATVRFELGAYAQILGGVRIGNNCRIGAMSVVLRDMPDGSTAVGAPARLIKSTATERTTVDRAHSTH